jgi:hypothetical protein
MGGTGQGLDDVVSLGRTTQGINIKMFQKLEPTHYQYLQLAIHLEDLHFCLTFSPSMLLIFDALNVGQNRRTECRTERLPWVGLNVGLKCTAS